jgi:hypothetical protein
MIFIFNFLHPPRGFVNGMTYVFSVEALWFFKPTGFKLELVDKVVIPESYTALILSRKLSTSGVGPI